MALATKTFKISRGQGVREIEVFIQREIGRDLSLIKDMHAISLNENTTQVTINYLTSPEKIVEISNPIPGLIVSSGTPPSGVVFQYASQFKPSTVVGASQVTFDDTEIPIGDIYVEPYGEDRIITVDVGGYYAATGTGIHNLLVDDTVLKLDGSSQDSSALLGFTVTSSASPFVGNEVTYTASQVRGVANVRYSILNTSVSSSDKTLSQLLANEKELYLFTTVKKSDSQTELFSIVVSKPEPRVIVSSPPFGANHPANTSFNDIYLTFSHDLNRKQIVSTGGLFAIVKTPGNTIDIAASYITLLNDNRTVKIDIDGVIADNSITNQYISVILKAGLLSFNGVATTKAFLLPYATNDLTAAGVGATGPAGPTGPAGASGLEGAAGAAGAQGASGLQGVSGLDGPTGPTGPAGSQGIPGLEGSTGASGNPGMVWSGIWDETLQYVPTDVVSHDGSSYIYPIGNVISIGEEPAVSADWEVIAQSGTAGAGGGGGGSDTLSGLTDTDVVSALPKRILYRSGDGDNWVDFPYQLSSLSDTLIGGINEHDILTWDSTNVWVNGNWNASDFLDQGHVSGGTHFTTGTIDHDKIQNSHNLTNDIDHDQLTNFDANEHFLEGSIDHTAISNIGVVTHTDIDDHIANSGDVHYTTGTIDHDKILNSHNLSTDIDHDALTNFASNEHFTEASIDHDNILNNGDHTHAQLDLHITASANSHIDWSAANALNISDSNYTQGATNFDGLSDYNNNDIADTNVLAYDSNTSTWHPTGAGGGGGSSTLSGLTDYNGNEIQDNNLLTYDLAGDQWHPTGITLEGIGGLASDSTPQLSGYLDAGNETIVWTEQYAYVVAGEVSLDFEQGNKWHVQLDEDSPLVVLGDPQGATNLTVVIEQGPTGNNHLTWPAAMLWPGGQSGVVSTGAGALDILNMYYNGSGSYMALLAKGFQ